MSSVSSAVKAARTRAGLSQPELAIRAGVSQAAVSRIEAGRRSPGSRMLLNLARALGVSVEALIDPPKPRGKRRAA